MTNYVVDMKKLLSKFYYLVAFCFVIVILFYEYLEEKWKKHV